jgi:poly(hydroxyalkanoate) depolymerase family esterase
MLPTILIAAQTAVASFGSNPGALLMYEHVPANVASGAPLVVVLHGCTQTASSMESSGWDTLADQFGFVVAYAQQQSANNIESCFNWYDGATDDARGAGEALSITQMVDYEISTHGVDTTKVYVTGFSAGAAMTAVVAATYPDRFAAASIMSGLPFACAATLTDAYSCMNPGVTKTADAWGALVRAAFATTTYPRIQIWHGSSDTTVAPMNEGELAKQWTDAYGIDMTVTSTETIGSATRTTYGTAVETWLVAGMDHAVALGTDGSIACPGTATQYFEDHGVCSTVHAAQFFGLVPADTGSGGGSGSATGSDGSGGDGGGGGDGSGSGSGTTIIVNGCNAGGASGAGVLAVVGVLALRRRRRQSPQL